MSAIFGIWHKNGEPVDEKHLQKMQSEVSQYGRDAQDVYLDHNIGLGCCLNKWSKYSQEEVPVHQDARSEIFLACDALIYNRDELIEKHCLTDNKEISSQELLLAAYKKWGEGCAKYINGDFTFAIWEKQKKQLLLFRDHLGVRPIYYYNSESTFAFATDYRALLALPFVGRQLDEFKLYAYLSNAYHIVPEATFFQQIRSLPQAHALCVGERELEKNKYWIPGAGTVKFQSEEEYAQALYDVVNDAIKLRINGIEGKIGADLSGGIDSSVVSVLTNRELTRTGQKPFLLSWAPSFELFEKQPRDEREWVELVCRQEGLESRYLDRMKALEQGTKKGLPTVGGSDEIYRRELELMSAHNVRFVLTGWGGDEGISHRANLNELFLRGYWGYFFKEIRQLAKGSPLRFAKLIFANTIMPLFGPYAIFGNPNKGRPVIINKKFLEKMKKNCKRDTFTFKVNPQKHIQSGGIQTRTELLAWVNADYNTQHLYPFLDYRVIDFAMSIPGHWYYKNGMSRYLYCKAFDRILPENLCYYTTKDDIATITYRNQKTEDWKKAESAINRIDREIFSKYIDFDILKELVHSSTLKQRPEISRLILRKVEACYKIQQYLLDAENKA